MLESPMPAARRRIVVCLLAALAVSAVGACQAGTTAPGPSIVQPGAPGRSSQVVPATPASPTTHTDADVHFMQGMIGHHAQALDMTALLYTRSRRDDMKLLAKRIDVSQADEIKMMRRWLVARGEDAPDPTAGHQHGGALMPGMLTPEEMARLSGEAGDAFDRLFLELMIKHHEGAITMVQQLFSMAGAGLDSEIFAFASDVEADQSAEIRRMRGMLAAGR